MAERETPSTDIGYLAAKGAVIALTRGLAGYWGAHGIRVNAVAPGIIRTPRTARMHPREHWERLAAETPLGRVGSVDDVVGGVLYLASPRSNYVTGHVLVVDGGWTVW
jgi:NAD(P)-dependent dehydrogenase (short-subunit alcohol dehydrogenase family)